MPPVLIIQFHQTIRISNAGIGSPFSVSFPVVMLKKPRFFAKLFLPGLSVFSMLTKNYKLQPIGGQMS
jgi:hypothetical protein